MYDMTENSVTAPHLPADEEIVSYTAPRARAARRPGPSRLETADNYPFVVAFLDLNTRVIECAQGIQWIVQRRRGCQWHSVSFCRTKEGLLRCAGQQHPALTVLPARFPERAESSGAGAR
jgi:hypothetical protein